MSPKSAHRDVALWRYDRPSRGYFGYHLRARNAEARARFRDRLAEMKKGETHLFRLGADISDNLASPWPRVPYSEVHVTLGPRPATVDSGLALALEPGEHAGLLDLLDRIAVHEESSVTVETGLGAAPLWVWWDAA